MSDRNAKQKASAKAGPPAPGVAPGPTLIIDSEVTRRIRQHARAHPKTEVCGVLIGNDTDNTIDIRASIEALHAAQAGTHVTFTQDAWEEIYRVKDELYPDDRIVGWYHSHPGFGVFLSEHDLFIQQNFFSSPGQVAWVYDPQTDEEGCFGWVSGEVHRLPALSIADRNGDGIERTPKSMESSLHASDEEDGDLSEHLAGRRKQPASSPGFRAAVMVLTHLTTLLAGFAIAYFLFPQVIALIVDSATGQVEMRDGHALLPYVDGRVPLPMRQMLPLPQVPNSATPAPPPPGTLQPATPSTPGRSQ